MIPFEQAWIRDNIRPTRSWDYRVIATASQIAFKDDDRQISRLDHLLAVGRREFLANGYQRTSVDGIGKAAGVSKQTIYRHFNDKSDILRAIVLETSDAF